MSYDHTLYLPKTSFPMRAGLSRMEPEMLKHWDESHGKEAIKILENLGSELLEPPYHYHMDQVASLSNSKPLKTDFLVEELRNQGFSASGVHYNRKGFRTDAGLPAIKKIFKAQ